MNNSSTGGVITPHPQFPPVLATLPNLTLTQFVQTLLVALSELPGPLVRPEFQEAPPKQPDIQTTWVAFHIGDITPDANAYSGLDQNNVATVQRQELFPVRVKVTGPKAAETITLIRDGFQVPQNQAQLVSAGMGFAYDSPAVRAPDLVNERWINRYVSDFFLRRYVVRAYPILSLTSANGIIYSSTAAQADYQSNWQAGA